MTTEQDVHRQRETAWKAAPWQKFSKCDNCGEQRHVRRSMRGRKWRCKLCWMIGAAT